MPQIALVSHQHDDNVCVCMVSQFLQPSCHILVGLVLADVVNEKGAHSAAVVGRRNSTVPLLASGIPDLRLDRLGIDLNGPGRELDADRGLGV